MNSSYPFPIGIKPLWLKPLDLPIPDARLRNWLLDTGSLTERLQAHCRDFQVQVIGQRQAEISLEEMAQLKSELQSINPSDWQVREVLLWGDGQPWVFARSIIPQSLCSAELAGLGNQALGKLIFNDVRFKRFPFEITHIPASTNITQSLRLHIKQALWGRRSVFKFQDVAMSVAEIFLPNCPAYADIQETQ